MGYNITASNIKEIEDFKIPVTNLLTASSSFRVEMNSKTDMFDFTFVETQLRGVLDGDSYAVSDLWIQGDGSQDIWEKVLKPLFKKSKGKLKMILVYEGGDQIFEVEVHDGKLTEKQIL